MGISRVSLHPPALQFAGIWDKEAPPPPAALPLALPEESSAPAPTKGSVRRSIPYVLAIALGAVGSNIAPSAIQTGKALLGMEAPKPYKTLFCNASGSGNGFIVLEDCQGTPPQTLASLCTIKPIGSPRVWGLPIPFLVDAINKIKEWNKRYGGSNSAVNELLIPDPAAPGYTAVCGPGARALQEPSEQPAIPSKPRRQTVPPEPPAGAKPALPAQQPEAGSEV